MEESPELHRWRLLHQIVVRAYPHYYRQEYEQPTLQVFDDILHEAVKDGSLKMAALSAIGDTFAGVVGERFSQITNFLTNREPRYSRQRRRAALILGIIVVVLTGSLIAFYPQLSKISADAHIRDQSYRTIVINNYGYDNVAANFVSDYVMTKYYGDSRTDVGYDSSHAQFETTEDIYIYDKSKTSKVRKDVLSLKQAILHHYPKLDDGFDPLVCSKQAPIAVKYINQQLVYDKASVVASFSYPDSSQNLVRYDLRLDRSISQDGNWLVNDVDCLSASALSAKPFVDNSGINSPKNVAQDQPNAYSTRNDRIFK